MTYSVALHFIDQNMGVSIDFRIVPFGEGGDLVHIFLSHIDSKNIWKQKIE